MLVSFPLLQQIDIQVIRKRSLFWLSFRGVSPHSGASTLGM